MKMHYPKEWFERSAEIEGTAEVGAGSPAVPCSAWSPIESAPTDGTHILCLSPDDWTTKHGAESILELWWDHDLLGWHNQRMGLMRPTHWMPKPSPPNANVLAPAGEKTPTKKQND